MRHNTSNESESYEIDGSLIIPTRGSLETFSCWRVRSPPNIGRFPTFKTHWGKDMGSLARTHFDHFYYLVNGRFFV